MMRTKFISTLLHIYMAAATELRVLEQRPTDTSPRTDDRQPLPPPLPLTASQREHH